MNFKEIISKNLELNQEEVTMELSPQNNSEWTSLKQVRLITALENEYGIKFTFKEMKQLKNIASFVAVLKEKGIEVESFA